MELITFPWHVHSSVLLFAMKYFAQNKNMVFCSLLLMTFCSACTPCTFKLYCILSLALSQWGQLLKQDVIRSCSHRITYLLIYITSLMWQSHGHQSPGSPCMPDLRGQHAVPRGHTTGTTKVAMLFNAALKNVAKWPLKIWEGKYWVYI